MKSFSLKGSLMPLAIAFLLVAVSCNKFNTPGPEVPTPPEEVAAPEISLSGVGSVIYPPSCAAPCSFSFSVNSEDDDVSVSVSSSAGLKVELDLAYDRKSGSVKVSATDKLRSEGNTVTLTATNGGGSTSSNVEYSEASVSVEMTSVESKVAGLYVTVPVASNVGVAAKVSVDAAGWLHVTSGEDCVTIIVDRNGSFEQRTGEVIVSDSMDLIRRTISVSQAAAIDYATEERKALVALWNATGGENWKDLSNTTGGQTYSTANWCTDAPIDSWYGVTVNSEGHVMYLHLSDVGLKGTLPEEIGDMTFLQELWLSGNELSGPLPAGLGRLPALKDIDISGMGLRGNLEDCALKDIASHLKNLSLAGNLFSGGFPEWVGDMPENANFWLQGNCLSGKVPEKVRNHPRWNAEVLDGSGRTVGQINMEQREGYVLE